MLFLLSSDFCSLNISYIYTFIYPITSTETTSNLSLSHHPLSLLLLFLMSHSVQLVLTTQVEYHLLGHGQPTLRHSPKVARLLPAASNSQQPLS